MLFLLKVPGIKGLVRRGRSDTPAAFWSWPASPQNPSPDPEDFQPWETCMTMNETWGYNPNAGAYKPAGDLIRNLVEVVSRGGNYLLNVGPTPRGAFPAGGGRAISRHWPMDGRQWPSHPRHDLRAPCRIGSAIKPPRQRGQGAVYLHLLDWPDGRVFEPRRIRSALFRLLAGARN